MTNRQIIVNALRNLGVCEGDSVMMHSSLSALGPIDGGAETVVDALLETVGSSGTLLVPAFRDSVWGDPSQFLITDPCPCSQRLCPSRQPGFQGVIAEAVRKREGSLRSCHRTHSWVALGPSADRLLRGHRDSVTFCGKGSPFEELLVLDGCVLTLGVGVNTITFWHYWEELLQVPYLGHYWPDNKHMNHCVGGLRIQYEYPGIMQDVCRAAGILKEGKIAKGDSGLMRARVFDSFMATIMADNPWCMTLRPPDRECGNLAIDALRKAEGMLRAWAAGPKRPANALNGPPAPIPATGPGSVVRKDCPAFAGYQDAQGHPVPLCRANGRHPELFRTGGLFNACGVTTCDRCIWNETFPKRPSCA